MKYLLECQNQENHGRNYQQSISNKIFRSSSRNKKFSKVSWDEK